MEQTMSNTIFSMDEKVCLITGGSRGLGYAIAEAFFENNVESTMKLTATGAFDGVELKSKVYSDQQHMIKKTDMNIRWIKLLTSYDVRNLRFYLHVTYRLYNSVEDTFSLVQERFPIKDENYWQTTCRFISDY